jgi:hypothetical protein
LHFLAKSKHQHNTTGERPAREYKHEFETREFTVGQGRIALLPLDHSSGLTAQPIETTRAY